MTGSRTPLPEHNWERWGSADERGALNLIGPAEVISAAGLVRDGRVFELGDSIGPATPMPGRRTRPGHFMVRDGGDYAAPRDEPPPVQSTEDTLVVSLHTATHVDALAHVWYGDQLYNGHPRSEVTSQGARRCGVDKLGPMLGRGILLDLPRGLGEGDVLAEDRRVGVADLERCLEHHELELRSGDVVLLRTGWWAAHAQRTDLTYTVEPGPDVEAAAWLAGHDVAVVGADNYALEALPAQGPSTFPVHELLLRDCGVPIMEGLQVEELAAAGAREFLFVASPLRVKWGTASPLNPLAIT